MKGRRLLTLTLLFVVLGAGIAYASSPWGEYNGFTKVRVQVNGNEVEAQEVPAFVIGGRAVLPLREMAESMHALLKWDESSKTANLYKPNVHMFVAREVGKDNSVKQPFGKVKQGDSVDFVVFAQVDSLKTPIHSFKIELVHPDGTVLRSGDPEMLQEFQSSFWYQWPFREVKFDAGGEYKVRFLMKVSEEDFYTVVSEKVISSE